MIVKRTHIGVSKIPKAGLGLIASEKILSGEIIWENNSKSTLSYTKEEWDHLPEAFKKSILKYVYKSDNIYFLNLDDSRFFNHSVNPTAIQDEDGNYVAKDDIEADEEITCNYKEFYDTDWFKQTIDE